MRMRTSNYHRGDNFDLNFILRVHQRRFHRAAHRGVTSHHPRVPGFIHRRKVAFIGEEDGGVKNTRLVAALFFQHRVNLRQGIGGLLESVGIEICRHAGVVQGLVVDHHV
ncbi:Uncharacterised protein [Klebsiella pneumoniae]|uniref:Uncharacterized protein n=1 Tax=Klebsiella pneumoniae TaxID=573 RepID=A0A377TVD0_KLEPN|nr:Uncharacterised protein [Klebsiella pneumoniae]